MKILAIDDDQTILDLIYHMFKSMTDTVYKVKSFSEAKSLLHLQNFDMVFLDYSLPDTSEFMALEYVRKYFSRWQLPIIMLTADRSLQLKALEHGANDFICKPFAVAELYARTSVYFEIFQHKQSLEQHKKDLEKQVLRQHEALENALDQKSQAIREVCFRLGQAAEFRDIETGAHIKRMSHISSHLAKLMGFSEEETSMVHNASKLHDVGKVGIPDRILRKPGKLTYDEFEIMKKHTHIGAQLLEKGESYELIEVARIIALEHHEKYDGSGYPYGKSKDEIHLYARIVAVADVFDALCSKRVYKDAMKIDQVVEIMKEGRGKHFDPHLIDLFLDNLADFIVIRRKFPDEEYRGGSHDDLNCG